MSMNAANAVTVLWLCHKCRKETSERGKIKLSFESGKTLEKLR